MKDGYYLKSPVLKDTKKVEESEGMLRGIFQFSDDAIISKDLNGIITDWNAAAEKIFGYSEKEVLGKHVAMLIPSSRLEEELEILDNIRRGKTLTHFETVRKRKDGTEFPASITVSPIIAQSGEVIGATKILRDLTTEKVSEEKQAMLAAIVNSSDDGIVSKNLDGIITSWNPAAEKIFGYSENEAVGQSINLIIPEMRRSEEKLIIEKIRKGERIDHFETERLRKDGSLIAVSITVSPIRNKNGEVIGASKIARDISEKNSSHQKQAMLAAIIESSDDAIISKNLDGIITSWNPGAEKIFGYTESEAIGKPILMLIPPALQSEEAHIIGQIRRGRRVDHFETVRVTKEGKEINISLTVSPIKNAAGGIIGASKIARDITEQIKVQKQLEQYARQLKNLNNSKDEFIGMASHELKTPLTSITAYLQLLERNLVDEINKNFVNKTVRHVKKLSDLVSDLLDVSKIEAGKLQLNPTQTDLDELLKEAIETAQPGIPKHRIVCKTATPGITVFADRQRLEQVVINLLTNAAKYSPKADKIIVEAKTSETGVIVSVQDFGIGIREDQITKIFSRFYRAENLKPTFSGLGIGLFISKEIIERHHGKIWVESEYGKGSTFIFEVPFKPKTA